MVNFHSLRSFYVCAESLNFSKAAKRLGISQPSLSQQIRTLEENLGFELFIRNGRSVRLSARGAELYKTSADYFELAHSIERCVGRVQTTSPTGEFRVLVSDQIDRPFVAEVVAHLARAEKTRVSVRSFPFADLVSRRDVEGGDLILTHEKLEVRGSHLEIRYPVYLVASRRWSRPGLDQADPRSLVEFLGGDMVAPSDDILLGREYRKFRMAHALPTTPVFESNIVACLVRAVVEGTGACFLPLPYVSSSLLESRLNLYGPREGYWTHSMHVYSEIKKRDLENHPLVRRLRFFGAIDS